MDFIGVIACGEGGLAGRDEGRERTNGGGSTGTDFAESSLENFLEGYYAPFNYPAEGGGNVDNLFFVVISVLHQPRGEGREKDD